MTQGEGCVIGIWSVSISTEQIILSSVFCFFLSEGIWDSLSCELESGSIFSFISPPFPAALVLFALRVDSFTVDGRTDKDKFLLNGFLKELHEV